MKSFEVKYNTLNNSCFTTLFKAVKHKKHKSTLFKVKVFYFK